MGRIRRLNSQAPNSIDRFNPLKSGLTIWNWKELSQFEFLPFKLRVPLNELRVPLYKEEFIFKYELESGRVMFLDANLRKLFHSERIWRTLTLSSLIYMKPIEQIFIIEPNVIHNVMDDVALN